MEGACRGRRWATTGGMGSGRSTPPAGLPQAGGGSQFGRDRRGDGLVRDRRASRKNVNIRDRSPGKSWRMRLPGPAPGGWGIGGRDRRPAP
jgi:hypothetical protein